MTVYVDTSVIIALCSPEAASETVRRWFSDADQAPLIGDLARLEFAAFISRAMRTRRFDEGQAQDVRRNFDRFVTYGDRATHGPSDFDRAEELIRDFSTKLAAPDALHIATAVGRHAALLTLDQRMADAARMKGVEVINVVR